LAKRQSRMRGGATNNLPSRYSLMLNYLLWLL